MTLRTSKNTTKSGVTNKPNKSSNQGTVPKNSVRTRQEQRSESPVEGEPNLKKRSITLPVSYVIDAEVPEPARWGVDVVNACLGLTSPRLRQFLDLVKQKGCELVVNVNGAEAKVHGNTGCFVRDPDSDEGWILLEEAFLYKPELITKNQGFRVEVNLWAGPEAPDVNVATTMLHELELHAVEAGQLIINLLKGAGPELLDLVLDYMSRPDDHMNIDNEEQFVRTAARVGQEAANFPVWATNLFADVKRDAKNQFAGAAIVAGKAKVLIPLANWLTQLSDDILRTGNPDQATVMAKPANPLAVSGSRAGLPPSPNFDRSKVLRYLAEEAMKSTDLLAILRDARNVHGLSVDAVLDLYRTVIVPALLDQAPAELDDENKLMSFLAYYGVPRPLGLHAALTPQRTTPKDVGVKAPWPPPDTPVFWLTDEEQLTWTYSDGMPSAMTTATNLKQGGYVVIDGQRYRVAVTPKKPADPGEDRKPVYSKAMNKWITVALPPTTAST